MPLAAGAQRTDIAAPDVVDVEEYVAVAAAAALAACSDSAEGGGAGGGGDGGAGGGGGDVPKGGDGSGGDNDGGGDSAGGSGRCDTGGDFGGGALARPRTAYALFTAAFFAGERARTGEAPVCICARMFLGVCLGA
jgi:hypothetical protein